MAVPAFKASPVTRARLGRAGLEAVSRNLWAADCQTCGSPLGPDSPSLVVMDYLATAEASLHHPECRWPDWSQTGLAISHPLLTFTTRILLIPSMRSGQRVDLPTFLVNPSLERVGLQRDSVGEYRVATVERYAQFGLTAQSGVLDLLLAVSTGTRDEDVDWLPERVDFDSPTYDQATGRFELGPGMDGPVYWTLHTPGKGVESGLLFGPAGTGKTNTLRLIALEAYCSKVFIVLVADVNDRNGICDSLAALAETCARTVSETMDLLKGMNRAPSWYCGTAAPQGWPSGSSPRALGSVSDWW